MLGPAFQSGGGWAAEGETGAGGFVEQEEEGVAGGDEHLGVIAGGGELGGAGEQGSFEFVGALDGGAKDGGAEGVELVGGGVHDDEAEGREDFGEEAAEGSGEPGVGGIALAEEAGDFGVVEELGGAVEGGVEVVAAGIGAGVDAERADGDGRGGVEAKGKGLDGGFGEEG